MTTPTTRPIDWPQRLHALLAERRAMPFQWGVQDCCLFACDGVLAVFGHDPAEGLRSHRSARAAQAVLKRHGGIEALADARLGARIAVTAAQVGDVGLLRTGEGLDARDSLALCGGSSWLAPGADGLVSLPIDAARIAWRGVR